MIARFYTIAAFLSVLLIAAFSHYLLSDRKGMQEALVRTVAVTGLDAPALSVEWFEPRLRRFEASLDPAYPELLPTDRLDFVYGDLYGK